MRVLHSPGVRPRSPPDLVLTADARPETRSAVRCPHFGPCGGCTLLDLSYEEELALKDAALHRAFEGCAALAGARVLPTLAAAEPLFYRTSLKVPFDLRRGRPIAGFYRRGSHQVVELKTCAIQHPSLTRLLVRARELAAELGVSVYDERSHRGLLRHFLARIGTGAPASAEPDSRGTGEMLAGFVVRYDRDPDTRRLAEALFERSRKQGLVGVIENVNRDRGSRVLGHESRLLCGRANLRERSDDLSLSLSLTTFAQVNPAQASVLYAEVQRLLAPLEGLRVVDLYSGYGPIALRLARAGASVQAVEHARQAVEEGRAAADENVLAERVTFHAGDSEHVLRRLTTPATGPGSPPAPIDAIVVDPPRRGLSRGLLELLCRLRVPRLVVISCYPDTFLRDLELLSRAYAVRELRAIDLFPRTEHLESLALLEPR